MKTILVIEDNEEIRENTSEILELAGYTVINASNGKEGLLAATEGSPDIILCDIMMPGLDGYEVFDLLKNKVETSHIPIVYVSASAEKSDVKRAMDMGACGYVRKPFEVEELMEAINKCLAK